VDFQTFGCGLNLGIVVAGVGDNFVYNGVGVLGIVVIENQFLGTTFHDYVDGLAPVAVSPAPAAGGVFVGKILGVVDQNVCAFSQLADVLVEERVAGAGDTATGARPST